MTTDEPPEGWAVVPLSGIVSDMQTGFACGAHSREDGVPHLRPMNVSQAGLIALDDLKLVPMSEVDKDERWLRKGDIVFNNTNSPALVGKTAYYGFDEPRSYSNHMTRLRVRDCVTPQYLALFLHQRWRESYFEVICNNHVSQASISRTVLGEVPVDLPPLAEQRRIVAAVERILDRVNAARARLDRVPTTLKRFRQAVLAAACSGRLTADWRVENQSLLHGSDAVARTDPIGQAGDTDEFPTSWRTSDMARISEVIADCPHSTPKWTNSGEICLRTTNFQPGWLDLSEVRYVSSETYKERIRRVEPKSGDIVYSREGGILGIACQVPDGLRTCLGQRMMLMRVWNWMNGTFVMHVLNSPLTTRIVEEMTGGTASPHLNVGDVKAFRIPVPPLAEQHEIVKRVTALFARADAIEAAVAAARSRVDAITQAVLAKAFRGELVPTEAELARRENRSYETAAELLARVRATAATTPTPTRRRKPKVDAN